MTSIAPLLTPAAFESSVLAFAPRTAVFDCDGTLWSGDAGSAFMRYTIRTGLLSPQKIAWLNARYEAYNRGENSELSICGEMVQVYAGLPESTLRAAAAHFFRTEIEPHIFPELQRLVATLQQQNVDIWAVSSTNDWVIEEGMKRFNLPPNRVLPARVAITEGIITDTLIDVPTDQGKVDALARAGIHTPDAVFGNSVHDAAMLAIARRAFPTERWPIFHPA